MEDCRFIASHIIYLSGYLAKLHQANFVVGLADEVLFFFLFFIGNKY